MELDLLPNLKIQKETELHYIKLNNDDRKKTANTCLVKNAFQYSAETFVVNQSLVLRISICLENRHLRQDQKRFFEVEIDF